MSDPTYENYVRDQGLISEYLAYQARWSRDIRESDRVLIAHVADAVRQLRDDGRDPLVIDIGCSTGNLLKHLRAALPDVRLAGAEYSNDSLAACRADPVLDGIDLQHVDVTRMTATGAYDVAVVNAVLYLFETDDFESAVTGLGRALQPGGTLVAFDFFHAFPQELSIVERSRRVPTGIPLHFRPMDAVEASLRAAGFDEVRFEPFAIPIDLEAGAQYGDNASGFEDLNSYTVRAEDGRRMLFRGTLFQPWCHLVARKAP